MHISWKALPPSFVETVATFLTSCVIAAGSDIITMGDVASEMFFIARGTVNVVIISKEGAEIVVAKLNAGDCFGEAALLTNNLRSATIRAQTNCELFTLTRNDFDYVLSFSEELRPCTLYTLI